MALLPLYSVSLLFIHYLRSMTVLVAKNLYNCTVLKCLGQPMIRFLTYTLYTYEFNKCKHMYYEADCFEDIISVLSSASVLLQESSDIVLVSSICYLQKVPTVIDMPKTWEGEIKKERKESLVLFLTAIESKFLLSRFTSWNQEQLRFTHTELTQRVREVSTCLKLTLDFSRCSRIIEHLLLFVLVHYNTLLVVITSLILEWTPRDDEENGSVLTCTVQRRD